ncbi:hypothetical protein GPECTOR_38g358 [Gonium pectorale]|uniref:Protein kinase domain-containing protein n=1 Tax=Gonium pectorale TaxID=33097 RepID=A0A150GCR3_GONPE|nr:hypothetical protein GPECTOR_38g358 [Gonium pectorale]|eukprot:KXZ47120.1 hypothetical protein GPECTOR_38g358 [Gonium pectorale]
MKGATAVTHKDDFTKDVLSLPVYFCELRERLGRCEGVEVDATTEHAPAGGPRSLQAVIRALQAELGGGSSDLQISSVLGRGAFGAVYAGRWRSLPVAVKMLVVRDALAEAEGWQRQQAVLEAAISLSMAHENLVATYTYMLKPLVQQPPSAEDGAAAGGGSPGRIVGPDEITVADGGADAYKLYIVQELCNGGSLRQALACGMAGSVRSGGSGRLLALRLALDVARGVAHVHECRIVHGDLKPENVLLTVADTSGNDVQAPVALSATASYGCSEGGGATAAQANAGERIPTEEANGPCAGPAPLSCPASVPVPGAATSTRAPAFPALTAKVADFGLSLPLPEDATHQSKRYQGTPARTAPEVVAHGRVSLRSDVWSYGTMLIEFFYGCTLEDIVATFSRTLPDVGPEIVCQQLRALLLQDMSASPEREYTSLTASCFAPTPHNRPTFETIVSQLELIMGGAEVGGAEQA